MNQAVGSGIFASALVHYQGPLASTKHPILLGQMESLGVST